MKVAMIGQKGIPVRHGGVERLVEDLSAALVRFGYEVTVYTRRHYTSKDSREYRGVRLVSLPSLHTKHFDTITHVFLATWHAIWYNFDVIHYHGVGPALLAFLPRVFSPRTKVVVDFQSLDRLHTKWGPVARFTLRLGERAAVRFAHELTVPSPTLADYVMKTYGRPPLVIPNGVDVHDRPGREFLETFGLAPKKYILSASRLVEHKGIHWLIEAFRALPTDFRLVIVGDSVFTDAYVQKLRALAHGDARIIFTGFQSGVALAQLYAHAYLFVQPSTTEGMSLSILEAMSYATPVLASNIAENAQIVAATGFTFRSGDVAHLTERLRFVLGNPDEVSCAGIRGQEYVRSHFMWDSLMPKFVALYAKSSSITSRRFFRHA